MESNNFNLLKKPQNNEDNSVPQSSLLSPFSIFCDDVDHFDSSYDFPFYQDMDSLTVAQDINDFTDIFAQFDHHPPNKSNFSFSNFPELLSPDQSPLMFSLPSNQVPQMNLPAPLISSMPHTEKFSTKNYLQIPQLPSSCTSSLNRSGPELKREYRQQKIAKFLQKKETQKS